MCKIDQTFIYPLFRRDPWIINCPYLDIHYITILYESATKSNFWWYTHERHEILCYRFLGAVIRKEYKLSTSSVMINWDKGETLILIANKLRSYFMRNYSLSFQNTCKRYQLRNVWVTSWKSAEINHLKTFISRNLWPCRFHPV